MASGMGIPTIGIYSYELYHSYGVKNIIRVGTAGSLREDIKLKDIVIGIGTSSNSNYALNFDFSGAISTIASYDLVKKSKFGNILSTDNFFCDVYNNLEWSKMGVMAVEMEAYGLYLNATRVKRHELNICVISDELVTGVELSSEERQNGLIN